MTLTDTMGQAIAAIEKKRSAQEKKQSAQSFSAALTRLTAAVAGLGGVLDCMEAIAAHGISPEPLLTEELREAVREEMALCGRGAREGALTREMVGLLESRAQSLQRELAARWKALAPIWAEGALGYLAILGELTENPQEAAALADRISAATREKPGKKTVDAFAAQVKQARALTDAFALQPEMEAFLRKVKDRRATLADLTPDLRDWLDQKGLLEKLSIRF